MYYRLRAASFTFSNSAVIQSVYVPVDTFGVVVDRLIFSYRLIPYL